MVRQTNLNKAQVIKIFFLLTNYDYVNNLDDVGGWFVFSYYWVTKDFQLLPF